MSNVRKKIKFLNIAGMVILGASIAFIAIYYLRLGNYWDWQFPYFTDQISNFYQSQSASWSSITNLGGPLSYVSTFWYGFIIGHMAFLHIQSEWLLASILTLLLSLIFWGARRSMYSEKVGPVATLMALSVVFSPAIFYKLQSGHMAYLVSLPIFVYLCYFLLYKFGGQTKHWLVLAILTAFVGVQLQFFFFSFIVLVIYFLLYREKFSWKGAASVLLLAFIINLPWLSNFIIGANSVADYSSGASRVAFSGAMLASPLRLLMMAFSEATNLQYIYTRPVFAFFGLISVITIIAAINYLILSLKKPQPEKYLNRKTVFAIYCWLIFSALGTGYLFQLPIPYIEIIFPVFREVGHFAPIIIFFQFLVLAYTWPYLIDRVGNYRKVLNWLLTAILALFVAINAYQMVKYLPRVDYPLARAAFQPFKDHIDNDKTTFRVLEYPFWNQYGFLKTPNVYKDHKLLNNSGWDSFSSFSGQDTISNYVAGGLSFRDTLQYRLLKTNNIQELEMKNVKYIYDFSEIYQSNMNLYTAPDTYDNNLSLIKNDPMFISKLIEANPGKITKVSNNIYRLNDTSPRIFLAIPEAEDKAKLYFQKVSPTTYRIYIKELRDSSSLNFLESYHPGWRLYLDKRSTTTTDNGKPQWCMEESAENNNSIQCSGGIAPVPVSTFRNDQSVGDHSKYQGFGNTWQVSTEELKKIGGQGVIENPDGSIDVQLTLYFWPQTIFIICELISLMAILGVAGYLLYSKIRKIR